MSAHTPPQHWVPPAQRGPPPQVHLPSVQVSPGAHAGEHVVVRQTPMTQLWPLAHASPQRPQWLGFDWVSTHVPSQQARPLPQLGDEPQRQLVPMHVSPLGHGGMQVAIMHRPPTHACPAAHAMPQPPQCDALEFVSTHVPPQHVWPPPQAGTEPHRHTPPLHRSAFAPQAIPQPPQSVSAPATSMHAPPQHIRAPGQAVSPEQARMHTPPRHTWPSGHLVGQPPASPAVRPASNGVDPASSAVGPASRALARPPSAAPPLPRAQPAAHSATTKANETTRRIDHPFLLGPAEPESSIA